MLDMIDLALQFNDKEWLKRLSTVTPEDVDKDNVMVKANYEDAIIAMNAGFKVYFGRKDGDLFEVNNDILEQFTPESLKNMFKWAVEDPHGLLTLGGISTCQNIPNMTNSELVKLVCQNFPFLSKKAWNYLSVRAPSDDDLITIVDSKIEPYATDARMELRLRRNMR